MNKILCLLMALMVSLSASSFPKAIYVKKGDSYIKYNFGVAGSLKFLDGGKKLQITGYGETVDLENIDYVTFTAPVMPGLTPKASKERLIKIGHEALTVADAKDDAALTRAIDTYVRFTSACEAPSEWNDIDYGKSLGHILKAVATATAPNGNTAARNLTANTNSIYKLDDYYGIYTAKIYKDRYGDYEGEWVKIADADYFEFRYSNPLDFTSYVLTITPSSEYSDWIEDEDTGRIPHRVDISIKEEGAEICTIVLNNTVNQAESLINTSLTLRSKAVEVNYLCRITDSQITESNDVKINGADFYRNSININGTGLLDSDSWEDIYNQSEADEYYDPNLGIWVYPSDESGSMIAKKFFNGTFETDLLGKLQVKGRLSQVPKLYDILAEEYDDDSDEKDLLEKQVLYLNNYTDVAFYYDGQPMPQGYITWELEEDDDYYYTDYEIIPMLTFPDLTSFYFEDYFTVGGFSTLIDDLNDLIRSYTKVTGHRADLIEY